MKILLLSHTGAVTGGAEQCLLEYTDVLIRQGHTCKIIVPYKGEMTKALTKKAIPFTVIGYGWATKPHRRVHPHRILRSTGNSLVKIFQEVEKYKPEIIITNTTVIPWGLYAGKAFRVPTILLAHEILSPKDPSLRIAPNYEDYGEILNQNTDFVIYNSLFVKGEFDRVLKLPKTSKNILYPLPPLDEPKINELFKENIFGKKIKIGIFGAISPRKNQIEAIQAAKILYGKGIKNFIIDLYGDTTADPTYTKKLRRLIKAESLTNNVKIKGYATNVYEKMNEYNVVLSTSTYEPFGRTVIEGQLFGKVVITNNTGGGLELVDDLRTGLIYQSGDPNALADKINWVMAHSDDAIKLGKLAKTEQLREYMVSSRYDPLLEGVEYCSELSVNRPKEENVFDPLMSMFHYNHQLNVQYRHLYRVTHNRVTYKVKGVLYGAIRKVKLFVKQTF